MTCRPWLARAYPALHPILAGPHGLLVNRLGPADGLVLDLCTGTGLVAARIARRWRNASVLGIDLNEAMVLGARRRWARLGNCSFQVADAAALPLADGSVSTVVCAFGLHEIPPRAFAGALAETRRVLSPGGRFVALDFHPRPAGAASRSVLAALRRMESHLEVFLSLDLAAVLTGAGLTVVHDDHPGDGLFRLVKCEAGRVAKPVGDGCESSCGFPRRRVR